MIIKTSEATPLQINYLVAKCENHESRCPWILEQQGYAAWQSYEHAWGSPTPNYSTDWACGGPIIEREIDLIKRYSSGTEWYAQMLGFAQNGPTPLIAAMRCYVVSKLGDEVEIPKELK